jgi:SAM-dependent methyltransferase
MCGESIANHKVLGQRLNTSQGLRVRSKRGISVTVMKCKKCGLIFSNPQPVPSNIQDHYGLPPESYWIPEYFVIEPDYFSTQISKAKNFLPFYQGMKALDIGAGIGKSMIAMERAGFDAYGAEPSAPFYDRAINKMNIRPEKLKNCMLEELDYETESFDFITFSAVMEHLYNPDAAIQKALTWLKPDGIIHIEVPSSDFLISRVFNLYYRLRGVNYVTNISPMHPPFHMYEFTLKSFQENQKKNNYRVLDHTIYPANIMHIPRLFHGLMKWYMNITKTGMQLEVWIKKNQ